MRRTYEEQDPLSFERRRVHCFLVAQLQNLRVQLNELTRHSVIGNNRSLTTVS